MSIVTQPCHPAPGTIVLPAIGSGPDPAPECGADGCDFATRPEVAFLIEGVLNSTHTWVQAPVPSGNPTTDLATLQTKLEEAKTDGSQLFIDSNYEVEAPFVIGGTGVHIIFGLNGKITQLTASEHALEMDEASPPQYLTLENPTLVGLGHATSTGSGIYGRRGNDAYFFGDLTIIGGTITGFNSGVQLRHVVKIRTERLDILNCVTGYYMDKWDTYLISNTRVVGSSAGGAIPNSRCFFFKDQSFGGKIVMGEFGGANIARFCEIDGISCQAFFEGCNLEEFTSPQVSTMDGGAENMFSFRNGRCANRAGATTADSFISIDASNNLSPKVEITGLSDWSRANRREVEIIDSNTSPRVTGYPTKVTRVTVRGGAAIRESVIYPVERAYATALPGGQQLLGERAVYDIEGSHEDYWMQNHVIKVMNYRSGVAQWVTTINEIMMNVYSYNSKGTSIAGTKVAHTLELPAKGVEREGESVSIRLSGTTAANVNNKQWLVKINGTTMFDSGNLAASAEPWKLEFHLQNNPDFEEWDCELRGGSTIGNIIQEGDTDPIYSSSAMTITVEVVGVASSDITFKNGKGVWTRTVSSLNP
jgi:hypothetical protein